MVLAATGLVRTGLDVGARLVDNALSEQWIRNQKNDQKKLRTGCCTFSFWDLGFEICCGPAVVWRSLSSSVQRALPWCWPSTSITTEFSWCCKIDGDGAIAPEASSTGVLTDESAISIRARVCVHLSGLAISAIAWLVCVEEVVEEEGHSNLGWYIFDGSGWRVTVTLCPVPHASGSGLACCRCCYYGQW